MQEGVACSVSIRAYHSLSCEKNCNMQLDERVDDYHEFCMMNRTYHADFSSRTNVNTRELINFGII